MDSAERRDVIDALIAINGALLAILEELPPDRRGPALDHIMQVNRSTQRLMVKATNAGGLLGGGIISNEMGGGL